MWDVSNEEKIFWKLKSKKLILLWKNGYNEVQEQEYKRKIMKRIEKNRKRIGKE